MIFIVFFIDGVIFLYYYFGVKRKNDELKKQTQHFCATEGKVEELQQKMIPLLIITGAGLARLL